jgi:aryl-alcohol dehydrogenase (NADP+)
MRVLGRSGVQVSELGLGTMVLGAWGNQDHAACTRIVHAALDAGINLVDTADVYAFGESEEIVGAALEGRRDAVVLATKFHNGMGDDPNMRGNSRRWIVRACEDSLRRLRTDRIDLYQVHRPDPTTDLDETLGALSDLVHQGKILSWGTSTFPAEDLVEVQWTAERRGHVKPVAEQPPYSIFARGIERDVLPTARRFGQGVLAWSPLSGGWLTGKYRRDAPPPADSRAATNPDHFDGGNARKLDLVEELAKLAADAGLTLSHLALAWALEHPAVTSVLIGPRTEDQLAGLVGADAVRLDADLLDRVDELVAPGTTISAADEGWVPPGLAREHRRRPR